MAETPARILQGPLPALLFFIFFQCSPAAAEDSNSPLVFAQWRFEAFGRVTQGLCCWLEGPGDGLRLEVTAPSGENDRLPGSESVLAWRGDGWTIVLGEPGQGTLNRWHEQWRNLPPGWEEWIRGILARYPLQGRSELLSGGLLRDRNFLPRLQWRQPGTAARESRFVSWEAPRLQWTAGSSEMPEQREERFRDAMVRRGRGRGGAAEVVRFEFVSAADAAKAGTPWPPGSVMNASSSRRPGTLHLEIRQRRAVGTVAPEVFLPLWPLDEFIAPDEKFQGTTSVPKGF